MPTKETTQTPASNSPNTNSNFFDKVIEKLEVLTVLEINTVVGNFSFVDKGKDLQVDLDNPEMDKIVSRINLLSGDITTAMTPKFVSEYKELRKYHATRENEGHQIIEKNIKVLTNIADTIVKFNKKKQESLKN